MENILKIVYDYSISGKILDIRIIEKIIALLIDKKDINNYVSNISVISKKNSKMLASYCNITRIVVLNRNVINYMMVSIEKNLLISNNFEKILYKNLSIIQVVLHELEHATQEKILYTENSVEAFLLRISSLVNGNLKTKLYEVCPDERLAEIKSFEDIISIINPVNKKFLELTDILQNDRLQRLLRGYHYKNGSVNFPLIEFMKSSNNSELLELFDWYNENSNICLNNVVSVFEIDDRFKYGFPIALMEYSESIKNLVLFLNNKYKDKVVAYKNIKSNIL